MKNNLLYLITCLIIFSSFKPIQQGDNNQLYKVIIFKWVKNEKGQEQKKVVVIIDQEGKIIVNNEPTDTPINLKTFTKAINKFINNEKLVKEPAYNGPPKTAIIPKNSEQCIAITVIKLKDFNAEKDYDNNSSYILRKITKSSDENIILYKYLKSDDLKTLKKLLNK
jgi:hypothetical protein